MQSRSSIDVLMQSISNRWRMFCDIMRPVLCGRKGVCRPVGERQPEVVIVEVGKEANEWLERRAVGRSEMEGGADSSAARPDV